MSDGSDCCPRAIPTAFLTLVTPWTGILIDPSAFVIFPLWSSRTSLRPLISFLLPSNSLAGYSRANPSAPFDIRHHPSRDIPFHQATFTIFHFRHSVHCFYCYQSFLSSPDGSDSYHRANPSACTASHFSGRLAHLGISPDQCHHLFFSQITFSTDVMFQLLC